MRAAAAHGKGVGRMSFHGSEGAPFRTLVIPGRRASAEPGIHNYHSGLWIPGLRLTAHPGMTTRKLDRSMLPLRRLRHLLGRRLLHRAHVEIEQGFVLVALVLVLLAQLYDLSQDLHV